MGRSHLREAELASIVDEDGEELPEHLRWCTSCRNALADYRWLEQGVGPTLRAIAAVAPAPPPRWPGVQERLRYSQRRAAVSRRLSGVVGAALAICLTLSASPALSAVCSAQARQPEAVPVPLPASVVVLTQVRPSSATPTPALFVEGTLASVTPPIATQPTPPGAP